MCEQVLRVRGDDVVELGAELLADFLDGLVGQSAIIKHGRS